MDFYDHQLGVHGQGNEALPRFETMEKEAAQITPYNSRYCYSITPIMDHCVAEAYQLATIMPAKPTGYA